MNVGLHSRIDHTNYKPTVTPVDIQRLATEAATFGFRGICVNLGNIATARAYIDKVGTPLHVSGIVDFPLGASGIESKLHQAGLAKRSGATELDTVLHIGMFLHGDHAATKEEIVRTNEILPTKFIIEHALLDDEQVLTIAKVLYENGAFCLKLATGFIPSALELKIHHIRLIRNAFPKLKIKASGGIKTMEEISHLVDAGADFIGTSQAHTIFRRAEAIIASPVSG